MHGNVKQAVAGNPLRTKADVQEALLQIMKPLKPYYSEQSSRLLLGATGSSYTPEVSQMEGFSRVLWGLVPLFSGGYEGADEWAELYLQGVISGTDPNNPGYWGEVGDYDQRLVEMAAFGYALAVVPDRIWEPLTEEQQHNLYIWLNQINDHPVYDCNWLFFRVLVNMGFLKLGLPFDAKQMEDNLNRIDEFYMDEGWYADGENGHSDYYVPFALHYYGLLYVKVMGAEDPERSQKYKERAREFAAQFIQWFTPEGPSIPYGRSLTYRFSQGAFWGALAFVDEETLPYGVLKGLLLRHLRWWFRQPIFGPDGVLTIGYAYPNLIMAENYNAPGSPYWSLKAFLPLALPDNHPFWTAEELPLPELPEVSVQKSPHMVICRDTQDGHAAAFNTGHLGTNEHPHTSAKYEKFVYSTVFGFSVPRAEWGISQGAFDSMLAVSEGGDNLYRVRRRNEETNIDGRMLYSRWRPWKDVEIRTWIFAGLPWHLRLHRIDTARPLDAVEGGFALKLEEGMDQRSDQLAGWAFAKGSAGTSGIAGLVTEGSSAGLFSIPQLVHPHSNTNLLYPRTVIPSLLSSLEPGIHWLVSAICGHSGQKEINPDDWRRFFTVEANSNHYTVITSDGKKVDLT